MVSATGRNFLAPPYYSQRVVFASPASAFSLLIDSAFKAIDSVETVRR